MTITDAGFTAADYARWRPRLLRLMGALRRRGYEIPMTLALDIVHDFFVEAWPGVLEKHDPSRGALEAYVAGAFLRFAQRRVISETKWSRALDDRLDPPGPSGAPEAPTAFDAASIALALSRIGHEDRRLLLARFGDRPKTEQALAEDLGISRYAVRSRLLEALVRLAASLGVVAPADSVEARIARMIFIEGRSLASTAASLRLTSAQVRAARGRILGSLASHA